VSLLVEDGIPEATGDPALPAVGIDRGVAVTLALSDGRMIDQDFTSAGEQAAIGRLQARLPGNRTPGPRHPWPERTRSTIEAVAPHPVADHQESRQAAPPAG
jgi:hypothetical protein